MGDNEQKSQLWKTYGILMGIMIGGSVIVLVGQSVWNGIQAEQTRQANIENETYNKYTQLFQKALVNNEIAAPPTDRTSDISKAKQYCNDVGSAKINPQQDWKNILSTPNIEVSKKIPHIDIKQATSLVQIQIYCPENLKKLPKVAQTQLSILVNTVAKESSQIATNRPSTDSFINEYYSKIKSGQTSSAWNDISSDYQNNSIANPGGYGGEYVKWWGGLGRNTQVSRIETVNADENSATVHARCRFQGNSYTVRYHLIFDNSNQSWKINKIDRL